MTQLHPRMEAPGRFVSAAPSGPAARALVVIGIGDKSDYAPLVVRPVSEPRGGTQLERVSS